MQLQINSLSHKFNKTFLFRNLDFSTSSPSLFIVKGKNGSGKSTFLRIVSGFIFPTSGTVAFEPKTLNLSNRHEWIGYCSPTLNLYGELSGMENLELASKLKNKIHPKFNDWVSSCGLSQSDFKKPFKSYSSGMKQRIKILVSVSHQPELVLWDEPMTNLDRSGKEWVISILNDIRQSTLIFIASNEEEEIALSEKHIDLDLLK